MEKPQPAVSQETGTTVSNKVGKTEGISNRFGMAGEKAKGILLLLSSSLGIGCLGVPSSVAQLGIGPWAVIIISVAAFYYLSYYVILKLCDHYQAFTVSHLGAAILGSRSFSIDFLFVVVNLAGYLACLITLNEDMPILMRLFSAHPFLRFLQFSDFAWIYISTGITITILVILPVRKLHNVTFISAVSSIFLVLFVAMGAFQRGVSPELGEALKKVDLAPKWHIFMFLGFAFLCQQNLMTMYQASSIRNFQDIISTVRIFTVILLVLYALIGVFGFLTFFDTPALKRSNILELYHSHSSFYALTLLLVNLNIQVGNAVVMYPILEIIMDYVYGPKPSRLRAQAESQSQEVPVELKNRASVFFRSDNVKKRDTQPTNASFDWSTIKKPLQIPEQLRSPTNRPALESSVDSNNDSIDMVPSAIVERHNSLKALSGSKNADESKMMSVRSLSMNNDYIYRDLVDSELGFFRNYQNVTVIVAVILPFLCALTAHVLIILNVKFYDAVDIVSKVFFPILFFYLPMLAFIYTFKNYWILIPLCIFLSINIVVFF